MTDITELAQMKGQKVEGSYYLAECTDCGKMYPSNKLNGGEPLFSGDHGECYCPHCNADDAAIGDCGDTAAIAWNYQQGRIDALVEVLEKAQADGNEYAASERAVAVKNVELHDEIYGLKARIAELESRTVSASAADLLAERQRQVTAEGWSSKHDDQYKNTELAFAASCYAFHAAAASWDLEDDGIPYDSHPVPKQWPWDPSWWKPTDARRDLVKAGALILAEIERIDRAAGIKWEAE
ncbi:TPA: hypothetical protein ACGARS_005013 [Klebsiella pneumoniae]|uniref:hypothetical protein n=1 Tax=Klebsiella pneumoniae TaxID=573 RepID=UPI001E4E8E48|nr:hypothetical protein [Klebsiella pneumoniae]HCT2271382.1 hypothetical protein [Klebsiella pneumoniae]